MARTYYSQRIRRGPFGNPTTNGVARALALTIDEMWKRDYMQEWYGFTCVDAGEIIGRAAMPLADHIEVETGKVRGRSDRSLTSSPSSPARTDRK